MRNIVIVGASGLGREVVGGKMLKGGEPSVHIRDNGFNY